MTKCRSNYYNTIYMWVSWEWRQLRKTWWSIFSRGRRQQGPSSLWWLIDPPDLSPELSGQPNYPWGHRSTGTRVLGAKAWEAWRHPIMPLCFLFQGRLTASRLKCSGVHLLLSMLAVSVFGKEIQAIHYSILTQGISTNGTFTWVNPSKYRNPFIISMTVLFQPNQVMFNYVDTTKIVTKAMSETTFSIHFDQSELLLSSLLIS